MSEDENKENLDRDTIIEKLLEEYPDVKEIASFNEFDAGDKLTKNAFEAMRYRDLWVAEKFNLERLQMLLDKVTGERYHHYRFNMDEHLQKSEIETYYLPKDPDIIRIKKLMLKQKVRAEFFESVYKALTAQQWNIKNFIEFQRM